MLGQMLGKYGMIEELTGRQQLYAEILLCGSFHSYYWNITRYFLYFHNIWVKFCCILHHYIDISAAYKETQQTHNKGCQRSAGVELRHWNTTEGDEGWVGGGNTTYGRGRWRGGRRQVLHRYNIICIMECRLRINISCMLHYGHLVIYWIASLITGGRIVRLRQIYK